MFEEKEKASSRLKEITAVLRKHNITRGVTPEKLRLILEELGPTYIKLGQIMSLHSDILPKRYCEELMKLCSEVSPMSFLEVEKMIQNSYGIHWTEVFSEIDEKPIGSASIAQVHHGVLVTGEEVVIKVQRRGIYETMAQDISLLHKAVRLLPPVSLKEMIDLDMVLDELWVVSQEEMDFLKEAANMEEFTERNKDVMFVRTPKLYRKYTTDKILVMEYIDGCAIDDKEKLLAEGYDLEEVGSKLVDNYIRQVMEDGFFHADPHPGNVRVKDGKIIWIDMGMMGRLTERDRRLIEKAIRGIAINDIGLIEETVMALGEFRDKPDQSRLYEDISALMTKYGNMDMGDVDIAVLMQDLMEIMKENHMTMPHGLTMLARGLTHIEGVLAKISPELNMIEIAKVRMRDEMIRNWDWKKEIFSEGRRVYRSIHRALDIPTLAAELLEGHLHGQTRMNLDLHVSKSLSDLLRRLIRNIVMGLWVMALLISSSIICTTNMQPQIWGIPAIGAFGYLLAFAIVMYVFIKHIFSNK